jgi:retron-type reverse transcriptase
MHITHNDYHVSAVPESAMNLRLLLEHLINRLSSARLYRSKSAWLYRSKCARRLRYDGSANKVSASR